MSFPPLPFLSLLFSPHPFSPLPFPSLLFSTLFVVLRIKLRVHMLHKCSPCQLNLSPDKEPVGTWAVVRITCCEHPMGI